MSFGAAPLSPRLTFTAGCASSSSTCVRFIRSCSSPRTLRSILPAAFDACDAAPPSLRVIMDMLLVIRTLLLSFPATGCGWYCVTQYQPQPVAKKDNSNVRITRSMSMMTRSDGGAASQASNAAGRIDRRVRGEEQERIKRTQVEEEDAQPAVKVRRGESGAAPKDMTQYDQTSIAPPQPHAYIYFDGANRANEQTAAVLDCGSSP